MARLGRAQPFAPLIRKQAIVTAGAATAYTLTASPGAVVYAGVAATLRFSRAVAAAPGAVVYAGAAATLRLNRAIAATAGNVVYAGAAATLTKAGGVSYTLTSNVGAVVYAGAAATLRFKAVLVATAGNIRYGGSSATLTWSGAPVEVVTSQQKGAGKAKRRRERKKYVIDGKVVWATPEELPDILATMLVKAEPEPIPSKKSGKATNMPPASSPISTTMAEPEPWDALYARILSEFQAQADQQAIAALQQAEAMARQWEAEDEADIEFIVLHTLH